jgi:phosphoglycolate phosphatase-like HAD superfamily hydrolase
MASQPTIFLFDVDGTLLLTGGCGRRAFEHAFEHVTGQRRALDGFSFGGMTDRAIARMGLCAIGREANPSVVDQLLEAYLEALARELVSPLNFVILPGAHETVQALAARSGTALGLGTGNVRRGAQAKLAYADLWHPFSFGGFGCDHEDRAELLRAGAQRGAAQLSQPLADCRVVVIGDTVRDVAAAHAIGAECVAVCTGGDNEEKLRAAGADAVFQNLLHTDLLAALVG